ncbi:MAG: signal peptide peptidase SppA [bacterium]|nr:signal peptide peptidase SppA [bacterium]MCX7917264.1 signal peptide peptidase SppA [bacterium]MDW8163722.1 signal peptide peptidase SppA [Candidatus Omnitrophota bacterium]
MELETGIRNRKIRKKQIAGAIVIFLIITSVFLHQISKKSKDFKKEDDEIRKFIFKEEIKLKQKFVAGEPDAEFKIALIKLEGEIIGYPSKYYQKSVSEIVRSALDLAKQDEKVKGIIIQINSPGGDIIEVEKIYEKIEEIKKSKIIVSLLENIAASGGYYCACGTNKIIANPLTITGNIGAVILFYNVKELFEKKLGINMIVIKSGKHKDIGSPFRKMDIEEKNILQNLVDEAAKRFLNVVLKNRKIRPEDIPIVSDGRIFTGIQAKEIGLVDEIGTLKKAIETIKEMTKIKKLKVIEYYYKPSLFELLGFYGSEKLYFSKFHQISTPVLKYIWIPNI